MLGDLPEALLYSLVQISFHRVLENKLQCQGIVWLMRPLNCYGLKNCLVSLVLS
jgi:hypothetical protein